MTDQEKLVEILAIKLQESERFPSWLTLSWSAIGEARREEYRQRVRSAGTPRDLYAAGL